MRWQERVFQEGNSHRWAAPHHHAMRHAGWFEAVLDDLQHQTGRCGGPARRALELGLQLGRSAKCGIEPSLLKRVHINRRRVDGHQCCGQQIGAVRPGEHEVEPVDAPAEEAGHPPLKQHQRLARHKRPTIIDRADEARFPTTGQAGARVMPRQIGVDAETVPVWSVVLSEPAWHAGHCTLGRPMFSRDEQLQRGIALHRDGRLAEAEALYNGILAEDPHDADALHLLGLIADAGGAPARAVALIQRALEQRDSPRFRANLGMVLGHLGRHEEALASYQRALQTRPDYPEALNNLGTTLEALGRPAEAVEAYRKALALRPTQSEWWSNLGNALRLARQPDAAEEAYRRAVELSPARPEAHAQLGHALRASGRDAEAEVAFRAQLALRPDDPDAHINLAASLGGQDHAAEAAAVLPAALALAPHRPEAHHNLAVALLQLGRLQEAEDACRRALALRPDFADALDNLGNVLREQGRPEEAEVPLRRALAIKPNAVQTYNNLAIALADQGRVHEAMAVLDLAAGQDPADADTRHHRAMLLLLQGRLAEGWAAYEARFDTKQGRPDRRGFAQRLWEGESLCGRTILLHAEQGLGDTLQFCRYAPLVARSGGRVVLEVQPPLKSLLARLSGVDQIVAKGEALPDFDVHCPLLSLPHVIGTVRDTIPAEIPYLTPPSEARARWHERLSKDDRQRVGVVWAGNPRHVNDRRRSLPFEALAPLWAVPRVAWFSLQVGPQAADLGQAPSGLIEDLSPDLVDFAETAAALVQLDLVVTADTAVAHLAGALGKPAFVMLSFAPDWRWLRQGANSPWYRSLRLFRQDAGRRWAPVIDAVAKSVEGFV
jgi:tetratricopeptide (TPR) repeat protein